MKSCNITAHAVEQFIRRWGPDKTVQEAEEEIEALFRTSKHIGKTNAGDDVVASGYRPEIRLVIKERNVCVTVLPPEKDGIDEEEMEHYQEIISEEARQAAEQIQVLEKEVISYERDILQVKDQMIALSNKRSEILNRINYLKKKL